MKTVWRYVINVGFIAISIVICALMITRMEKEREENAIDPLDGFRVFLEGEEPATVPGGNGSGEDFSSGGEF